MKTALFIMRATNRLLYLLFLCRLRFSSIPTNKNRICTRQLQTAVSPHPLRIGHVYMNLFTRNSTYCHLLKYLLFLLKHSVYYKISCVKATTPRSSDPPHLGTRLKKE
jgi:hypothetical protein